MRIRNTYNHTGHVLLYDVLVMRQSSPKFRDFVCTKYIFFSFATLTDRPSRHGHTYPTLQARANDMFYTHVARPQTMLTTLYGSITGD